jgi:hypothetical protein
MKEILLFCIFCCSCACLCYLSDIRSEIKRNDNIMQEKERRLTDTLIMIRYDTPKSN